MVNGDASITVEVLIERLKKIPQKSKVVIFSKESLVEAKVGEKLSQALKGDNTSIVLVY